VSPWAHSLRDCTTTHLVGAPLDGVEPLGRAAVLAQVHKLHTDTQHTHTHAHSACLLKKCSHTSMCIARAAACSASREQPLGMIREMDIRVQQLVTCRSSWPVRKTLVCRQAHRGRSPAMSVYALGTPLGRPSISLLLPVQGQEHRHSKDHSTQTKRRTGPLDRPFKGAGANHTPQHADIPPPLPLHARAPAHGWGHCPSTPSRSRPAVRSSRHPSGPPRC
jgi:hypothetical protein